MEDCYYFLYSQCSKGPTCPFRHCEACRTKEETCTSWSMTGACTLGLLCPYRHSNYHEQKQRAFIPCYWESHGGCTKPHCPFFHTQNRPFDSVADTTTGKKISNTQGGKNSMGIVVVPLVAQQEHAPALAKAFVSLKSAKDDLVKSIEASKKSNSPDNLKKNLPNSKVNLNPNKRKAPSSSDVSNHQGNNIRTTSPALSPLASTTITATSSVAPLEEIKVKSFEEIMKEKRLKKLLEQKQNGTNNNDSNGTAVAMNNGIESSSTLKRAKSSDSVSPDPFPGPNGGDSSATLVKGPTPGNTLNFEIKSFEEIMSAKRAKRSSSEPLESSNKVSPTPSHPKESSTLMMEVEEVNNSNNVSNAKNPKSSSLKSNADTGSKPIRSRRNSTSNGSKSNSKNGNLTQTPSLISPAVSDLPMNSDDEEELERFISTAVPITSSAATSNNVAKPMASSAAAVVAVANLTEMSSNIISSTTSGVADDDLARLERELQALEGMEF